MVLVFLGCSEKAENTPSTSSSNCVTCTLNAGGGQTATYQYCQVGNDVIYTSGNIKDTIRDTTMADLVWWDKFNLGAVCK